MTIKEETKVESDRRGIMSFVKSPSALVEVVPPLIGDTLHAVLTFIITNYEGLCMLLD